MILIRTKDHGRALERFYKHPTHGPIHTLSLPYGDKGQLLIAVAFRPEPLERVEKPRRRRKGRAA